MSKQKLSLYAKFTQKTGFFAAAFMVAAATLTPLLLTGSVSAAQILNRKLTLGSGVPSATTTYTFDFELPSATTVLSFSADACTTAVGTCDTPPGFSVTGATLNGTPTGLGSTNTWTVNTATAGSLRMSNASNTGSPSPSSEVSFSGVTNPSTPNESFFLRLTTYSDAAWTTAIDTGTTASAVVQTLRVNAAVAEVLNFCVGTTDNTNDNATANIANDCSTVAGTSVNLGTLDTSTINVTPSTTNCTAADCNKVALAMARTNAASGMTVSYDAIQQSGSNHKGALRIGGQNCDGTDGTPGTNVTDPCINSAGTAQDPFSAGTEEFGMTSAGINCGSTSSYTCVFASSSNHLTRTANYDGLGSATYGSSAATGFAWDETGTAATIASSNTVVDDEAVMLHFAATPSITTPFGSYSAQTDFIAVPTY